jgi:hypothetical protein
MYMYVHVPGQYYTQHFEQSDATKMKLTSDHLHADAHATVHAPPHGQAVVRGTAVPQAHAVMLVVVPLAEQVTAVMTSRA